MALGAWNEQHCYTVATDFARVPDRWWYMGDIPHGWAAAEFNLLLRDILFFEAGEDDDPHIYLAPGVMPHWVRDGERVAVDGAPTVFGGPFGYTLRHDGQARAVTIDITQAPPVPARYVYRCRFGTATSATADGVGVPVADGAVALAADTAQAVIRYQ